jgi:hypothetical protein
MIGYVAAFHWNVMSNLLWKNSMYYFAFSFRRDVSNALYTCLLRYPDTVDLGNLGLSSPGFWMCNQMIPTVDYQFYSISQIDWFDKLVGMYSIRPTTTFPTTGTYTKMVWFGECTTDVYYNVEFETASMAVTVVRNVYAKSSTENYVTMQETIEAPTATYRLVILKVHFDPNSGSCGSFAYSTPMTVKKYIPYNLCQLQDDCTIWYAHYRSDLSAIAYYGMMKKWKTNTLLSNNVGFAHAILLADIDAGTDANSDTYTTMQDELPTTFAIISTVAGFTESPHAYLLTGLW